jgi:hypothetical protein
MVLIAMTVLMGLVCLVLGYLVGQKQMVEILAGYNPDKVSDRKGLARWVGANLLLIGVLAFVTAGLMAVASDIRGILLLIYALGAVPLLCVRIVLGNRRFITK